MTPTRSRLVAVATECRGSCIAVDVVGRRILSRERARARAVRPLDDDRPHDRHHRRRRGHPARATSAAVAHPLPGRAAGASAAPRRAPSRARSRVRLPERLSRRLSDQGEPAARGRRGSARRRQAVRPRPRVRIEGGADRGAAALIGRRPPARLQRRQGREHAVADPGRAEARPERRARRWRSTPSSSS